MSIAISPKTTTRSGESTAVLEPALAVPLVCQNDKVESSRSAEQILGSGKSTAVLEPARAVPLVCQNDKVESSKSAEKILGSGEKYRCPRTRHYNSLRFRVNLHSIVCLNVKELIAQSRYNHI